MKKIIITSGDVTIRATLNDTVAAKDFETKLPFDISGHDSGVDYCCVMSPGKYDSEDLQAGWTNGDINWAGGWFALLYAGEEDSKQWEDLMIIGRIAEEDLAKVEGLPENADFTVALAE